MAVAAKIPPSVKKISSPLSSCPPPLSAQPPLFAAAVGLLVFPSVVRDLNPPPVWLNHRPTLGATAEFAPCTFRDTANSARRKFESHTYSLKTQFNFPAHFLFFLKARDPSTHSSPNSNIISAEYYSCFRSPFNKRLVKIFAKNPHTHGIMLVFRFSKKTHEIKPEIIFWR